jgi:flagellar biosynthesis chaperone FliJ
MMEAFDRVKAIHNAITADSSERVGLSDEEIKNQETQFKRIAAIANDNHTKARAKKLGIKKGTKRYRQFVSWINTADQIESENVAAFNSMVEQAQQILAEDGLSLNA